MGQVAESSRHTHEFAQHWSQVNHQTRPGYLLEPLPDLAELDEALRQAQRTLEGLARLKDAAVSQQHALAEQRARAGRREVPDDEPPGLPEDYKGTGGFAGGDAKKRRGVSWPRSGPGTTLTGTQKAAPPGRCHSCNRAETPEWRRGPDGARTLCNACGLHYAKLTRKMGVHKAATLTGSNLRPKGHEMRSPLP